MNLRVIEAHLRKQRSIPDDFHFFSWKCFPEHSKITLYIELEGACCPLLMSGKHKGRPNYRKMDKASRTIFTVLMTEIEQIEFDYEQETGKCRRCQGSKQELASCGVSGTTYRTCGRCKGTGTPKVLAQEAEQAK